MQWMEHGLVPWGCKRGGSHHAAVIDSVYMAQSYISCSVVAIDGRARPHGAEPRSWYTMVYKRAMPRNNAVETFIMMAIRGGAIHWCLVQDSSDPFMLWICHISTDGQIRDNSVVTERSMFGLTKSVISHCRLESIRYREGKHLPARVMYRSQAPRTHKVHVLTYKLVYPIVIGEFCFDPSGPTGTTDLPQECRGRIGPFKFIFHGGAFMDGHRAWVSHDGDTDAPSSELTLLHMLLFPTFFCRLSGTVPSLVDTEALAVAQAAGVNANWTREYPRDLATGLPHQFRHAHKQARDTPWFVFFDVVRICVPDDTALPMARGESTNDVEWDSVERNVLTVSSNSMRW